MKFPVLLFLLSCFTILSAQEAPIPYSSIDQITWADFKGPPDPRSENSAKTRSGVKYSYNSIIAEGELTLEFTVNSFFDPHRSWTKETDNDYLLNHELLHFKIAELWARKLRQSFALGPFTTHHYQTEIKERFQANIEGRSAMQKEYDRETNHSRNQTAQAKWEKKINMALENLSEYAASTFTYTQ